MEGLGAGLGALAFWGFVAVAVVAGIWDGVRKREAKHETLRRMVESGRPIDGKVLDKLLKMDSGERLDRGFEVTALWISPVAPGLAVLGLILGSQYPETKLPILGAAALVGVLAVGFYLASKIAARWYSADD